MASTILAPAHAAFRVHPALRGFLARLSAGGAAAALDATHRSLLLLRFALLNLTATALVLAAALQGWIDPILRSDTLHIVKLIAAVFVLGLIQCTGRILKLSRELDGLEQGAPAPGTRGAAFLVSIRGLDGQGRATLASALRLKLATRLGGIRHTASTLVLLGLVGTVVGFIEALSGVDPSIVGDAAAIGPMVSSLLHGMAIAHYTTLVGSLLNIWLMLDYRLVECGTVHFLTRLVEIGERHGRS
jgi:hypothetical protein